MPVNLMCPNIKCRSFLQIEESKRGKQIRCSKCGQVILVPAKDKAKK